MRRWPLLLSSAVLCAGGIVVAWGWDRDGSLLAGAGLVAFGCWLALEILDRRE